MKKTMFLFLTLVLLLSACQMNLSENSGVIIIDIDGDNLAREIGENGLPVLNKAEIEIRVEKMNGDLIKTANKAPMILTLPAGQEIRGKVLVKNLSAEWNGEEIYRVKQGDNTFKVKIKKKAVKLNNLLFTVKAETNQTFTSTLKIGEKKIGAGSSDEAIISKCAPAICRDNKGRIYLAYTDNTDKFIFKRYNSEGNEDKVFTLSLPSSYPVHGAFLASDWVTGKTYIYAEGKLYREDGDTFKEISSPLTGEPFAVSSDKLVFVSGNHLKVYKMSGDSFSDPASASKEIWRDMDFQFDVMQGATIKDILIRDDYIYLLFGTEAIENPVNSRYYTVGGLVRYAMKENEGRLDLSTAEKFGFSDNPSFENNMIKADYYNGNFYGPVSFIGFDEEYLYIADDGVSFEKTDTGIIVKENHDRIAKFKFADKVLSFEKAPSDVKWILDKEIKGTGTVTITIGDDDWE